MNLQVVVRSNVRFQNADVDTIENYVANFRAQFVAAMALAALVPRPQVTILSVAAGSLVVDSEVLFASLQEANQFEGAFRSLQRSVFH